MTQVWLLDENNFFTGESIFVEEVTENMTTVPYTIGYVKGKLVNNKWVEGATEEEIQTWKDSQPQSIPQQTQEQKMLTEIIISML